MPFQLYNIRVGVRGIAFVFMLAIFAVSVMQNLDGPFENTKEDLSSNVVVPSTSTHQDIAPQSENEEINTRQQNIQDPIAKHPIAWLMTFPNSGTTYTSFLVATVTGTHTATNYGAELHAQGVNSERNNILNRTSTSVLSDSPVPSWSEYNWVGGIMKKTLKPPSQGYILTKTHCGGIYFEDFVGMGNRYTSNVRAFSTACGRGEYVTQNITTGQFRIVSGSTPIEKVGRVVHIFRDPFDNVVARFRFHHKKLKEKKNPKSIELLKKYPNTRDGFRSFCNDLGEKFRAKEEESKIYNDAFDLIKDVPCHSDFFRYIRWHNMAFETAAYLGIPSMTIHYEKFATEFNKTKDELLQFLHQEEVNDPPNFVAGKTYRDYYTKDEMEKVSLMFSKLGSSETKNMTQHYFNV